MNNPKLYMANVREEWKKFVEGGITNGLSVRNEILDSWKRSVENGLTSDGAGATHVFDEKTLNKINKKSIHLLDAADLVIDEFAEMLAKRGATNCVINLCNEDTVILRTVTSGAEGGKDASFQNILPGAILDEKHTGTTGVSLARTTKLPYAIYGPEHFRQSARTCSCAAAPITNMRSNQLKGIVALSGEDLEIVPDTIGVITFIARTIESNLLLNYFQDEEILTHRFKEIIKRGDADLVLAMDADLLIIASSSNVHPAINNVLSFKTLTKNVMRTAKKIGEKYLYNACQEDPNEFIAEETGEYHIESYPVYRNKKYIGMILLLRDLVKDSLIVSGEGRTKKPQTKLIGQNTGFKAALNLAINVAPTDAPIMLLGETGAGKEGFAKTICECSSRSEKPFIAINCGALPKELIGSELFGYTAGAFTGASQKGNVGKLEAANGGTLFLDELSALPLDAQSYLLRVIEENELYRLGSTKPIPIDVRIICATNENLPDLIESKLFRADLYYRLNVVEIKIPSLRERTDDLPALIEHFSLKYSCIPYHITDADMQILSRYPWPGNVREIKNVLQSAGVLGIDPITSLKNYIALHEKTDKTAAYAGPQNLTSPNEDMERVVASCNGNIAEAARKLGVARSTIYRRMQQKS
ncbi:MAG: sigma 54-interacting transcriptional regulator [Clostridiales Family XIII bacterium]|nr:sigma 54-interacting transcriptional regulator [Clostridiales Family XIII bacterium]